MLYRDDARPFAGRSAMEKSMARPEVTGRGVLAEEIEPLAITIAKACELSGFGPTTIWAFLKSGRLKPIRVPGVRRTLVDFPSFKNLLAPEQIDAPQPRRRGRPRKHTDGRVTL